MPKTLYGGENSYHDPFYTEEEASETCCAEYFFESNWSIIDDAPRDKIIIKNKAGDVREISFAHTAKNPPTYK